MLLLAVAAATPSAAVPEVPRSSTGGAAAADRFTQALEPRPFTFPRDHAPHPGFRTEWWYFTGNLLDREHRRFGYELTLFRIGLTPRPVPSPSAWRQPDVWMAHLAVTDVAARRFRFHERLARPALGLAGARRAPLALWVEDWRVERDGDGRWRLHAAADDIGIELTLEALKPPVLHGEGGLSRKGPEPGQASYYYSLTRLATRGTLRTGATVHAVTGSSWMDREWSSARLAPDEAGWDWFALQLDDGRELMVYRLRRADGSVHPMSAGTLVAADGSARALTARDFAAEPLGHWTSPLGGRYPVRWRITVPAEHLALDIEPLVEGQELDVTVRYWEGAVAVRGHAGGRAVTGHGYMELTGHADRSRDE